MATFTKVSLTTNLSQWLKNQKRDSNFSKKAKAVSFTLQAVKQIKNSQVLHDIETFENGTINLGDVIEATVKALLFNNTHNYCSPRNTKDLERRNYYEIKATVNPSNPSSDIRMVTSGLILVTINGAFKLNAKIIEQLKQATDSNEFVKVEKSTGRIRLKPKASTLGVVDKQINELIGL